MKCLYCQFETSNPKFCSKSCAAKYNNTKYPKKNLHKKCKNCNNLIASSKSYCKICWNSCNAINQNKLNKWLNKQWDGSTKNKSLSKLIRNYLLEESKYACSKCGFNINHPDDGKTILEINHINGDGTDHREENLEVLCPNCHALTSSYRGRNYGNGRPVYYHRISK